MIGTDSRPVLITGGAGFIGCNIADRLAGEGHEIIIYDSLARPGVERNLAWLEERHGARIAAVLADIRDEDRLCQAVKSARAVFHMAAQVAVTTSMAEPRLDFEVNALGTLNLLEAARRCPIPPPIIFASTNKVYGELEDIALGQTSQGYLPVDPAVARNGIDESRRLDFHTPYGCSKGAADQYVLDYGRSFDVPTAVLRMSCIYGQRQMGTEDQGWVAHFLIRALDGDPITLYGDGWQVRDILDVADAVEGYLAVWRNIDRLRGRAFNLGGGSSNAVSLRTLLSYISDHLGCPVRIETSAWRAGDQRFFVADSRVLREAAGLDSFKPWRQGVADLAAWLKEDRASLGPIGATPIAQRAW